MRLLDWNIGLCSFASTPPTFFFFFLFLCLSPPSSPIVGNWRVPYNDHNCAHCQNNRYRQLKMWTIVTDTMPRRINYMVYRGLAAMESRVYGNEGERERQRRRERGWERARTKEWGGKSGNWNMQVTTIGNFNLFTCWLHSASNKFIAVGSFLQQFLSMLRLHVLPFSALFTSLTLREKGTPTAHAKLSPANACIRFSFGAYLSIDLFPIRIRIVWIYMVRVYGLTRERQS